MSAEGQFQGVAPQLQRHWDWRAAGNFLCGGLGAGFLVAAAVAAPLGALVLPLALIGMAFVGLGLLGVWLKIGRPFRALNVYRNPGRSWMSREAFLAPVLFLVGLLAAALDSRPLLGAGAVLGLVYVYAQARILTASKGIPAWRQDSLVPLIVATGLAEGTGLLLIVMAVLGPAPAWVPAAAAIVFAARLWAWRRYLAVVQGGAVPKAAVNALTRIDPFVGWAGSIVPILLLLAGYAAPGVAVWLGVAAGLLVWFAGWAFKSTLLLRAGYNQGYAIARTPVRGAGRSRPGGAPGWM